MEEHVKWLVSGYKDGQPVKREFDWNPSISDNIQENDIRFWARDEGWTDIEVTQFEPDLREESLKNAGITHLVRLLKSAAFAVGFLILFVARRIAPGIFPTAAIVVALMVFVAIVGIEIWGYKHKFYLSGGRTADIVITILAAIGFLFIAVRFILN